MIIQKVFYTRSIMLLRLGMMNNTFFNERMVPGNQWITVQLSTHYKQNDADKSKSNAKVKQVQFHVIFLRARKYHLIEIQPMTKNDDQRHDCNGGIISFRSAPHQDQQWCQEIHDKA